MHHAKHKGKYSMGKWKHLALEFAVHKKFEQIGTSYTASFSEDEQTVFQLTQFSSTMGLGTKVKLKIGLPTVVFFHHLHSVSTYIFFVLIVVASFIFE